jgi:hypothetical protein
MITISCIPEVFLELEYSKTVADVPTENIFFFKQRKTSKPTVQTLPTDNNETSDLMITCSLAIITILTLTTYSYTERI